MPIGVYKRSVKEIERLRKSCTNLGKKYGKINGRKNPRCGEDSPAWRGEKAGKNAIHQWVYSKRGNPRECEDCGVKTYTHYDWANISGKYKRDVNDYKRLCRRCHRKFDYDLVARGERNGCAILNSIKVIKIRELYASGRYTYKKLGKRYGVDFTNIYMIVKRKNWKHI